MTEEQTLGFCGMVRWFHMIHCCELLALVPEGPRITAVVSVHHKLCLFSHPEEYLIIATSRALFLNVLTAFIRIIILLHMSKLLEYDYYTR